MLPVLKHRCNWLKNHMEELISSSGYQAVERDTIYNIKRVAELAPVEIPLTMGERLAALK